MCSVSSSILGIDGEIMCAWNSGWSSCWPRPWNENSTLHCTGSTTTFRIGRLSAVRPSLVLRLRYHRFFGWCKLSKLPVAAFIPVLSPGSSRPFMTGERRESVCMCCGRSLLLCHPKESNSQRFHQVEERDIASIVNETTTPQDIRAQMFGFILTQ